MLEPTAVADILESLAAAGFNGKAVNERRSFVRVGEDQFDPAITLVDDPLAVGLGYDDEGTPRRRLVLVERGHDRVADPRPALGRRGRRRATGHAVDGRRRGARPPVTSRLVPSGDGASVADEVDGPAADSSVAELVAGVERGLLVSDFWYTRMLDPRTLAITGLTRNGVWLIEDGEVTGAAAQLPVHPVVRAGADAGQRRGCRAHRDPGTRRHVHGDVAALVVPCAAPRLVELHRRRFRLTGDA